MAQLTVFYKFYETNGIIFLSFQFIFYFAIIIIIIIRSLDFFFFLIKFHRY